MSQAALELIEKEKQEKTGKLDLGNCGLTDFPKELFELEWLEELNICNQYWDSKQKKWVHWESKGTTNYILISVLPSEFRNLKDLHTLRIRGNYNQKWHIKDCSVLGYINALTTLDLSSNQILDLSFLGKLTNLESLDLSSNDISDTTYLSHLKKISVLNLRENGISDLSFLKSLNCVTSLDLRENNIQDLSPIKDLDSLIQLYLSSNKISNISFLKKLINLETLFLSSNRISNASFLQNLKKLKSLDLRANQINSISFLEKLTKLTNVDLRENKVNDISFLVPLIENGLQINIKIFGGGNIDLYNNPITKPPMHIVENGTTAILNYFEQLEEGTETLHEARVIIVGESGAGKTTLFKKLKEGKVKVPDAKQGSTHGININQERIFKHTKGGDIKASIWDFGGQDTQNYLHQYFYAKDNLFILVCDHRAEKYRFDYWFEMITRLCEESFVIIVRNQKERVSAGQSLNINEYKDRFPNLYISSIDVDFKKNDNRWTNLIQTIQENLSNLPRVNQEIPKKWKPIRKTITDIKNDKKSYISYDEFIKICEAYGLEENKHQEQCLEYLHWLGYALHYEDRSLRSTIFIDPEWITKGLYEIFKEEHYTSENRGRFSQEMINSIWKKKRYKVTERTNLLNLLLKDHFEVCYKVEGSDNYLVPVLINNIAKEPEIIADSPYILRFKFPFMPFGFFSRLIVRLFDKIWKDYVWLTGVWLREDSKCFGKLEHYKDTLSGDEVFEISIYGDLLQRKNLLAEIRTEIFHIKKILFPNLVIDEQIPCICIECSDIKTPYFHNRTDLEKMAYKKQFFSQCKNSGEMIHTSKLLDSIIDTEELNKQFEAMNKGKEAININLQNIGNSTISTNVDNNNSNSNTNTINLSISNMLGEVQNLKEDFEDEKKLLLKGGMEEEEYEVALKDIDKAEKAAVELEVTNKSNKNLPAKSKNRLKGFIYDLGDENSTIHKGLKLMRKGRDYGVQLAELYNQVASNTGMPSVPPLVLEVIKKI